LKYKQQHLAKPS